MKRVVRIMTGLALATVLLGGATGVADANYGPFPNLPDQAPFAAHASYAATLKGDTASIMPDHVGGGAGDMGGGRGGRP